LSEKIEVVALARVNRDRRIRVAQWLPMGLIVCAAVAGFRIPNQAERARRVASAKTVESSGPRLIFLRDCATCHGADARGTDAGPSLANVGPASVDYWLTTGRMPLVADARPAKSAQGETPPGQRLADPDAQLRRRPPAYSPAVIAQLEKYIASIAPGGPPVPTVDVSHANLAIGGQIFRQQCAACHAWSGTGGALYQRAAPSLHRATAVQIAEAVRIGPGQMPAFGPAAVRSDDIDDLAAYVRYLDHPDNRGGRPLWYLGPVAEGGIALILGLGVLVLCARWIGERG
jgi:ubiquinol-cytochrome c reductase cytochrome c subunit